MKYAIYKQESKRSKTFRLMTAVLQLLPNATTNLTKLASTFRWNDIAVVPFSDVTTLPKTLTVSQVYASRLPSDEQVGHKNN